MKTKTCVTARKKIRSPWKPISTFKEEVMDFDDYDLWICGRSGFGSFFDEPEGFRVTDCYRLNGKWYHQTGVLNLTRTEINSANITHWMRPPKGPKVL